MDAEALAQALLGAATQRGAAHAEVWCRVRRGVRASSGSMSARATGTAAVLSVWMPDGRRGVASGTADPALAEAAVSGAAASAVQRRAHLPVLLPGLGLVDARNVSDAMVLETLEEIDADVAGAGGKTLRAHIDRVDDETVWASRALGSVRETARAWHLELEVAPAGRGTSGRYLTSTRTRSWATMASLPYGQTAAKRAVQAASARESVAQACPVVLLPGASATLLRWLAGQVVQASTGAQPAWLRRDEEVVHGKIHLRDDGLSVGGLRTCAFDAFGDPPRDLVAVGKQVGLVACEDGAMQRRLELADLKLEFGADAQVEEAIFEARLGHQLEARHLLNAETPARIGLGEELGVELHAHPLDAEADLAEAALGRVVRLPSEPRLDEPADVDGDAVEALGERLVHDGVGERRRQRCEQPEHGRPSGTRE